MSNSARWRIADGPLGRYSGELGYGLIVKLRPDFVSHGLFHLLQGLARIPQDILNGAPLLWLQCWALAQERAHCGLQSGAVPFQLIG